MPYKLQVIFRKRDTMYRALLRKITVEIRHPKTLRHPVPTELTFENSIM